jgi:hypothetical protein
LAITQLNLFTLVLPLTLRKHPLEITHFVVEAARSWNANARHIINIYRGNLFITVYSNMFPQRKAVNKAIFLTSVMIMILNAVKDHVLLEGMIVEKM